MSAEPARPVVNDVIGGRAHATIVPNAGVTAFASNPKLRITGVTSRDRSSLLPNVPSIATSGLPTYVFESWFGVLAPAGTPPAVVDKLNVAINKALAVTEVKARLSVPGVTPTPGNVASFNKVFEADHLLMNQVLQDAKLTAE